MWAQRENVTIDHENLLGDITTFCSKYFLPWHCMRMTNELNLFSNLIHQYLLYFELSKVKQAIYLQFWHVFKYHEHHLPHQEWQLSNLSCKLCQRLEVSCS